MRIFAFITILFIAVPSLSLAQGVDWDKIGKPLGEDTKDVNDRFVYFDESQTTDPNVSLSSPILSRQDMAFWMNGKISEVLTFTAQEHRQQIRMLKPYFTTKGFQAFLQFLDQQKVVTALEQSGTDVSTLVKFTPDILADAVFNDVYRWNADVPIMISYRTGNIPQNEVTVNLDVVRVPFTQNPEGLAFDHWTIKNVEIDEPVEEEKENRLDDLTQDAYQ